MLALQVVAIALIAFVLLRRFVKPSPAEARSSGPLCTRCGTIGSTKTATEGSFAIELVLWVCFIFPGLIYSIWRLTTRKRVCRQCGSAELIPSTSPRARQILRELRAPASRPADSLNS
jgi:hypothetical protein